MIHVQVYERPYRFAADAAFPRIALSHKNTPVQRNSFAARLFWPFGKIVNRIVGVRAAIGNAHFVEKGAGVVRHGAKVLCTTTCGEPPNDIDQPLTLPLVRRFDHYTSYASLSCHYFRNRFRDENHFLRTRNLFPFSRVSVIVP